MKHLLTSVLLVLPALLFGQLGTWNILNIKLNVDERISVFGEGQLRSLRFYNHFHYYEIKTGITYSFKNNLSLTAGFGSYNTYESGGNFELPMVNKEIRTWLQAIGKQGYGRVTIEHRYRAEQRWTSVGYRNRFRYRLSGTIPINNDKVEKGTFYPVIWNEIFFTNRAPYFERNRFFIGMGYEVSSPMAVQLGYLYQFDYRINDETGRDFLQVSLLFTLNMKKNKTTGIPESID